MTTCEDNIFQIFEKYMEYMKNNNNIVLSHHQRSELLKDLCKFMNRHHTEVENLRYTNYCMEKTCNNVVLFFNPFYLFKLERNELLSQE